MNSVTRIEIARIVGEAFNGTSASRAEIMDVARRSNARDELIAALELLRENEYRHLRDLWTELHHIPFGT